MFKNILEMDYLSKLYAFQEKEAALILFDFLAAFPSVSQEFLWMALEAISLPPAWIQVFKVFTWTIDRFWAIAVNIRSLLLGESDRAVPCRLSFLWWWPTFFCARFIGL